MSNPPRRGFPRPWIRQVGANPKGPVNTSTLRGDGTSRQIRHNQSIRFFDNRPSRTVRRHPTGRSLAVSVLFWAMLPETGTGGFVDMPVVKMSGLLFIPILRRHPTAHTPCSIPGIRGHWWPLVSSMSRTMVRASFSMACANHSFSKKLSRTASNDCMLWPV